MLKVQRRDLIGGLPIISVLSKMVSWSYLFHCSSTTRCDFQKIFKFQSLYSDYCFL